MHFESDWMESKFFFVGIIGSQSTIISHMHNALAQQRCRSLCKFLFCSFNQALAIELAYAWLHHTIHTATSMEQDLWNYDKLKWSCRRTVVVSACRQCVVCARAVIRFWCFFFFFTRWKMNDGPKWNLGYFSFLSLPPSLSQSLQQAALEHLRLAA